MFEHTPKNVSHLGYIVKKHLKAISKNWDL